MKYLAECTLITFVMFASANVFAGSLTDVDKISCHNQFGSWFVLNAGIDRVHASFLARNDGLIIEDLHSHSAARIQLIRDYPQSGILALRANTTNDDGISGKLSALFSERQEFGLMEKENLSILFDRTNPNEMYVENMDCILKFSR